MCNVVCTVVYGLLLIRDNTAMNFQQHGKETSQEVLLGLLDLW